MVQPFSSHSEVVGLMEHVQNEQPDPENHGPWSWGVFGFNDFSGMFGVDSRVVFGALSYHLFTGP